MVNIFVAVTDGDWFKFLSEQSGTDEVNFWQPRRETRFRALQPGELFLFKLHSPNNFIAGGGVFAHETLLPISLAWEAFGTSNGAASLDDMRSRVAKYRPDVVSRYIDYSIGCRLLESPFFFSRDEWIPVPSSWSRYIQTGKTYSTEEADGRNLWQAVHERLGPRLDYQTPADAPRYGEPVLIKPRLGQASFRIAVTDSYKRRCAITGERTLPVLEAAHIRPYASGGAHEIRNGILLRTDIHRLFDRGYVTISPDGVFEVGKRLKEDFDNGRPYYELHGTRVARPDRAEWRPSADEIRWHNSNVFLG